jgi:hypothetical protein
LTYFAERDSPRDQFVVTLFLLTVFGLLLGAGIKGKLMKAGFDTSRSWNASGKWWEVRTRRFITVFFCLISIIYRDGCNDPLAPLMASTSGKGIGLEG